MALVASRRAESERGTAVIEFALILPLLMCIILGMFTGGVLANRQIEITHAAREGARYGSMVPVSESFLSGTWATNVRDVVVERADDQLEAAEVCVALVDGDVPVPVSDAHTTQADHSACFDDSGDHPPGRRVQVQAATTGTLEAFFFTRTVDLDATVTSRYEDLG